MMKAWFIVFCSSGGSYSAVVKSGENGLKTWKCFVLQRFGCVNLLQTLSSHLFCTWFYCLVHLKVKGTVHLKIKIHIFPLTFIIYTSFCSELSSFGDISRRYFSLLSNIIWVNGALLVALTVPKNHLKNPTVISPEIMMLLHKIIRRLCCESFSNVVFAILSTTIAPFSPIILERWQKSLRPISPQLDNSHQNYLYR